MFCDSSWGCRVLVCSVRLWYFLIILTYLKYLDVLLKVQVNKILIQSYFDINISLETQTLRTENEQIM